MGDWFEDIQLEGEQNNVKKTRCMTSVTLARINGAVAYLQSIQAV
jgi:hypothetical protein